MLTPDGHLYLIDFGIARLFKPGQAQDTVFFGSPGYAAPEQYDKAQTTARSDIYSLGATLHQLLTGIDPSLMPFQFSPVQATRPDAPAALDQLIARMVDIDTSKRPSSVIAVRQELAEIARTAVAPQPPVVAGLPRHIPVPQRKRGGVPLVLVGILLVVLLSGGLFLATGGHLVSSPTPTPITALTTATPITALATSTTIHNNPTKTPSTKPPTLLPTPILMPLGGYSSEGDYSDCTPAGTFPKITITYTADSNTPTSINFSITIEFLRYVSGTTSITSSAAAYSVSPNQGTLSSGQPVNIYVSGPVVSNSNYFIYMDLKLYNGPQYETYENTNFAFNAC